MTPPRPPIDLPAAWEDLPAQEPLAPAAFLAILVCSAILGAGLALAIGAVWLRYMLQGVPG